MRSRWRSGREKTGPCRGLSLAVAMSDGGIALDDPAAKFIPQRRADPRRSRIRLRQRGSHTSGIEDAEADGKPHEQLTGWKAVL